MNIVTYSPKPWEVPDTQLKLGQHQLVRLVGELGAMVRQLTTQNPNLVFLVGFDPKEPQYIQEVEKLCVALPHAVIVPLHPQAQPAPMPLAQHWPKLEAAGLLLWPWPKRRDGSSDTRIRYRRISFIAVMGRLR